MDDDILNTIEVLAGKIRAKEEEANKLKKLVNELCAEVGTAVRFPDIGNASATVAGIRSDDFYGLTLTAAVRKYLERRKTSGLSAASVAEIFRAIKDGGYKFGTNSEENARISLGNALRKSSSIFHRLPNGQYGLLVWYPSAKAPSEDEPSAKTKRKQKWATEKQAATGNAAVDGKNSVTNKIIRDVILAQTGAFTAKDIEAAVKTQHPSKEIPQTKVSTVINLLKKKGILIISADRSGTKGATFRKA